MIYIVVNANVYSINLYCVFLINFCLKILPLFEVYRGFIFVLCEAYVGTALSEHKYLVPLLFCSLNVSLLLHIKYGKNSPQGCAHDEEKWN